MKLSQSGSVLDSSLVQSFADASCQGMECQTDNVQAVGDNETLTNSPYAPDDDSLLTPGIHSVQGTFYTKNGILVEDQTQYHFRNKYTVKPPKIIRALSRCRLIPKVAGKSVKKADVGVQVGPDPESVDRQLQSLRRSYQILCEEAEEQRTENKLTMTRLAGLQAEHEDALDIIASQKREIADSSTSNIIKDERIEQLSRELTKSDGEIKTMEVQLYDIHNTMLSLKSSLEDAQTAEEAALNKLAFLEEENECLLKERSNLESSLKEVHQKCNTLSEAKQNIEEHFLKSKLSSSEIIGEYIDELQFCIEEKKDLLEAAADSWSVKKAVEKKKREYQLEADRNRLVDEVQTLSSKLLASELETDSLKQQVGQLESLVKSCQSLSDRLPTNSSSLLMVSDDGCATLSATDTTRNFPTSAGCLSPKKASFLECFSSSSWESTKEFPGEEFVNQDHVELGESTQNGHDDVVPTFELMEKLLELRQTGKGVTDKNDVTTTQRRSSYPDMFTGAVLEQIPVQNLPPEGATGQLTDHYIKDGDGVSEIPKAVTMTITDVICEDIIDGPQGDVNNNSVNTADSEETEALCVLEQ